MMSDKDLDTILKWKTSMKNQPLMSEDSPSMEASRPWINIDKRLDDLLHLFTMKAITSEQYRALFKQLNSPDYENHVVAEEAIKKIISDL